MIPRILYRLLLWLHPPSFRRRFGAEMLWIFDETAAHTGAFADGFASLLRQWFLRSGFVWKLPLMAAGGLLAPLLGLGLLPVFNLSASNIRIHSLQSLMMLIAVCSIMVITLTLIVSVAWFRFTQKHRA